MLEAVTNSMARNQLGLRFLDPGVEANYRSWRKEETFSVMWLGALTATLSWISIIPASYVFMPNVFAEVGVMQAASAILFFTGTAAGLLRQIRPRMIWVVTAMNFYGGTGLVLAHYFIGESLAGALASAILILLYAPFMRLPPGCVVLACAPYSACATGLVIYEITQGKLGEWDSLMLLIISTMGFLTVLLVCAVLEALLRRSYTREQLILKQQRGLEESRRMIRRYVPPSVADKIIAGASESVSSPQRRRVTILFSDIVGFTDMADQLDAESLTQILNEYMAAMADIVEEHGGTLNEFTGDGIMSLFGAPQELAPEQQALNAIAAAQSMHRKIPALYQRWRKLGLGEELKIRIGINTGVLSVGSFGSEGRMTYTAIGLQTNIAARIQSHCEPGGILISDVTYQLVDEHIDCEPKGEVDCKGVHFPVKTYSPCTTSKQQSV